MERIIKVIRSRNDIIDLLQKYIDVQNDFFTNNYYLNAKYAYGIVLGQFLDEAPMTMKTIEKEVPDAILYNDISLNYKFRGKNELELKVQRFDHRQEYLQQMDDRIKKAENAYLKTAQSISDKRKI